MPMQSEVRAQAGKQTVLGTGVTPTIALRGVEELKISSANDVEVIGDMTQALAGGDIGIINGLAAKGSHKGWGSYEHICYWLENLFGEVTPTGTTTKTRAYAAPITTAPTIRLQSLVKGDSVVGAYRMVGAMSSSLTLRAEPKKRLQVSGDLVGVKLEATTLASLSAPAVNVIQAHHLDTIKWDTWAGTMGATTLANCTVRFAELMVKPDRNMRACFGNLAAQSYVESPWDGTLKLGLEFNATTKTDVDAIVGGTLTQKQVSLAFNDTVNRQLKLEFAGTVQDDLEIFGDNDGVVTVEVTLKRTYHPTFANWLKVTSINQMAALT